jgi:phospholipase D1/2
MSTKEDRDMVASLWPDMKTSVTGQYFCTERPFTLPRTGNRVTINKDGETNFRHVYEAIKNAETFIFIVDWQLSIDFELIRPSVGKRAEDGRPYRLTEVLAAKVMEGVDVRILIYDAPSFAESSVPTYDSAVAGILNSLAADLVKAGAKGSLQCIQQGPTSTQLDAWDYSHHQKMVLVDGKVGFVGGMDLTNGRWDTSVFDCVVNPERYTLNDMYNPCLDRGCAPAASELVMTKTLMDGQAKPLTLKDGRQITVKRPGFAPAQYDPKGGKLLDPGTQPRMPWQDVHIMLEGPSLIDLYKNVVRRLDGYVTVQELELAEMAQQHGALGLSQVQTRERIKAKTTPQVLLDKWRGAVAKNAVAHPQGKAQVQIVRSVSSRQLKGEAGYRLDDLKLETAPGRAKLWEQAIDKWQHEHQDNIYQAMLASIASARAYIYIETQFFISEHGGTSTAFIDNKIVNAIANKIIDMARAKKAFHVYLVLPVHPEGAPSNEATYKQQRLAMDTLKWGTDSLFKRIQKTTGRNPEDFVTVLNLRTHGVVVQYARDKYTNEIDMTHEIGRYVVTEQIYVHSKLMIVDDAVAIIGSANTNDRSLTGNGDSEIAAVVVDTEDVQVQDLGNGSKIPTRKFARELRQTLWRKHLGLDIPNAHADSAFLFQNPSESARDKDKGRPGWILNVPHPPRVGPSQANFLKWEACIKQPAAPKTFKSIQQLANSNTMVYEKVFLHIPSDRLRKFDGGLK